MKINYLAIIACPFANMLLGMAWYGLFATQWMTGHGLTEAQMNSSSSPGMSYLVSFALSLATAFVLSLLFRRMSVKGWLDGLKTGAAIGFFGLSGTLVMFTFAMKPMSIAWIDGGFAFVLFCVYGLILGGLQKSKA